MSVPELERTKGRFEVINKCLDLCIYTLQITKNENVFLPELKDVVTSDIISLAKAIYIDALTANNIRVTTVDDYHSRRAYQNRAINECNELLANINIAKRMFHLKTKRIMYWSDKITTTQDMLRKWRDKDKQRYGM